MRKWSSRQIDNIFLWFFLQKLGFDISCKLSPVLKQFAWTLKSYFMEKNKKKNISKYRLLNMFHSMLSVNT